MINNKAWIYLLLLFFNVEAHHNQIVQISIQKTGSHLLAKCISLLTGRQKKSWFAQTVQGFDAEKLFVVSLDELELLTNFSESYFWITHLFYSQEAADILAHKKCDTVFIYRDPRDQVVSLAYHMLRNPYWWPKASSVPLDIVIMDIISQGSLFTHVPPQKNVAELYNQYLFWMREPHVFSIRFEDLVGERGGGSHITQLQTIKKIAQHLHVDASNDQIHAIAATLFGNTTTFREGQIGSWKKHFNAEHIAAFKQVAGNLLIELGYEQDLNW